SFGRFGVELDRPRRAPDRFRRAPEAEQRTGDPGLRDRGRLRLRAALERAAVARDRGLEPRREQQLDRECEVSVGAPRVELDRASVLRERLLRPALFAERIREARVVRLVV